MENKVVQNILKNLNSRKTQISVIGLGYVGLPLCLALCKANFKVYGIDNSDERVDLLRSGKSYISTISNLKIKKIVNKKFIPTSDFEIIKKSEIIIICVPTPIDSYKKPDMQYVKNVVKQIEKYLEKNQTIILECTSYPGTTEEYFLPIFKKKKIKFR